MGITTSKKLSNSDLEFLKKNTNFSEKQIKAWFKGFMRDCPTGQLTRDKFLEVYTSFFPRGDADRFCSHVFRTFDEDNSGMIDFREFMLAIYITSAGKPEQKLAWAFQMYDVNGDGSIEPQEMIEIISAIYNMVGPTLSDNVKLVSPEDRTTEIFAKMDVNKDGLLSMEEFLQGCMDDKLLFQMLTSEFEVV